MTARQLVPVLLSVLTAHLAPGGVPWAGMHVGLTTGEPLATHRACHEALRAPDLQLHADDLKPLPFFHDLYTFRGPAGSTDVVSAFAVEAGRLETERVDARTRYRFSVTLVLADTTLRTVTNTHDTVYVDVPRRLADDHLLYTHVEVQAPPSRSTRQRVIMTDATTPGVGQLYHEARPIPDYSGTALMLSDIALGRPDTRSGWQREGVALALFPTTQFPASAFDVYYEIYNMTPGVAYMTEIRIDAVPQGDGARAIEPVRLRFSGEAGNARGGTLAELRRIEAALPKGSYSISVKITDSRTGAVATQSRTFSVRGADRGATMVAALPLERVRRR